MDDNGRDFRPFRIALEAIQTPNALLDLIRIPRQIDVDEDIRALEIAPLAPRHVAEHHAADGIVLKAVGIQLDLLCGHPRPEEADLLCRKDMCERSAIRLERLRVIREEHDLLIIELLAEQVDDGYETAAARVLMCIRIVQNIRQTRDRIVLCPAPLLCTAAEMLVHILHRIQPRAECPR